MSAAKKLLAFVYIALFATAAIAVLVCAVLLPSSSLQTAPLVVTLDDLVTPWKREPWVELRQAHRLTSSREFETGRAVPSRQQEFYLLLPKSHEGSRAPAKDSTEPEEERLERLMYEVRVILRVGTEHESDAVKDFLEGHGDAVGGVIEPVTEDLVRILWEDYPALQPDRLLILSADRRPFLRRDLLGALAIALALGSLILIHAIVLRPWAPDLRFYRDLSLAGLVPRVLTFFGADPRRPFGEQASALHVAARRADPGVVAWLLARGADPNARDRQGRSPLDVALLSGSWPWRKVRCLAKLRAAGARRGYLLDYAGQGAARSVLLHPVRSWTEAQEVLADGVEIQLADGAGETMLHAAARKGDPEFVAQLLARKADPNAVSRDGLTPLMVSAVGDVARKLIDGGAAVEARDPHGRTALMRAAERGQLDAVKALLERSADLNTWDDYGETALDAARELQNRDVADLLAHHGARTGQDLDADGKLDQAEVRLEGYRKHHPELYTKVCPHCEDVRKAWGGTALHHAAALGELERVDALLDRDHEPDMRNELERTALHVAAELGHLRVVERLIARGANVSATAGDGATPLDLATAAPIREVLLKHGAKPGAARAAHRH